MCLRVHVGFCCAHNRSEWCVKSRTPKFARGKLHNILLADGDGFAERDEGVSLPLPVVRRGHALSLAADPCIHHRLASTSELSPAFCTMLWHLRQQQWFHLLAFETKADDLLHSEAPPPSPSATPATPEPTEATTSLMPESAPKGTGGLGVALCEFRF